MFPMHAAVAAKEQLRWLREGRNQLRWLREGKERSLGISGSALVTAVRVASRADCFPENVFIFVKYLSILLQNGITIF